MKRLGVIVAVLLFTLQSFAQERELDYQGAANWNEFRKYVLQQRDEDEKKGLGYIISGGVAAVGGTIGFYQSEEVFSRTVFAITSNIGLAAIGLGASYYWTGSDVDSFFYAIDGSSLSLAERNEVLQRYLEKEREAKESRRWIRVATYSLIALANLYSATQEESADIQSVFYFLGGANALLAISYSF